MPSRNELNARARVLGIDPANYPNDSKLEQKLLWAEKNATTFSGTAATGTLTSDNTNVSNGETVTIGSAVYTFKTALTGAKATQTLTSDATAPSDGDTVSIEGQQYIFKTALSSPSRVNEVLIGGSAAAALDNLKIAINASGGTAGTEYSVGTVAHPKVTATTNTNTTQVVEARSKGTEGNRYLVAETSSHLSWGAATLTGGAAPVAYEVLIGADADGSLTNLKAAVAGTGTSGTDYAENTPVNATGSFGSITSHAMTFTATDYSVTNADVATTETSGHLSWGNTTLTSGVSKVVAVANSAVRDTNAGIAGDKNV